MWFVLSIIFILLTLTLVLSFPSVQTTVAQKGVNWVNGKYETDIQLEKLRYVFPDQIVLNEVYLPDEQGDTMVYASEINLHFSGFNSMSNTASGRGVDIENLKFYWIKQRGDDEYNFKKFIRKFSSEDTTSAKPFNLNIADAEFINGRFRYEDLNCDSCFRMDLHRLNAEISDFDLEGSYFTVDVDAMEVQDMYSLNIQQFTTDFAYLEHELSLRDLEFKTIGSYFDGHVVMEFEDMSYFRDFVNKVELTAEIKESELESEEIQLFGPEFPDFGRFAISGSAEGIVNDLHAKDIDLNVGVNTRLTGDLSLRNTTDVQTLFLDAANIDLTTIPEDIHFIYGLFSDTALPGEVDVLGNISLQGNYTGYLNDFVAQGEITTDIGILKADLLLHDPSSVTDIEYQGDVSLERFDLGALLNDSSLGVVSTHMQLNGRGSDPTIMNTELKGEISVLQYNGYNYNNISINGNIKNSRFNGKLNIDDQNLKFKFNGAASFGQDTSKYNFMADIVWADLHALNFTEDSIAIVTADMDIHLTALNYEQWAGDIRIYNSTFENRHDFYFFQDIIAHSEGLDTNRYMEIRSNILDANLRGDYSLTGLVQAFRSQLTKYLKSTNPIPPPKGEDFNFDITIKNAQILTQVFLPNLGVQPNTKLTGNYSSSTGNFNVIMESPGFSWKKNEVENVNLNYQGGIEKSQLGFEVGSLELGSGFQIDSISLGNYYYRDTLFYDLSWIFRDSIDSRATLTGYALQKDTIAFEFGIFESAFNVGFQQFMIKEDNRIFLDTGGIHIEDLIISNEGRAIYINGNISDNPHEILRVNFRGFGMEMANYFIGSPTARFRGELYGDVILTEILESPKFAADIWIDSLEMNNTLLGDFNLSSVWTVKEDTIHINTGMKTGDLTTFTGKGYYQPDSLGSIAFSFDFDRFRLAAFNPFLSGIAENLRGYLTGNIKVEGSTGKPIVTGEVTLPRTAFTLSMLQTDYNFVGTPTVKIREDEISFPDLVLKDTKYGTEGKVTGSIKHANFKEFILDLNIKANELLVLNTTADTEDPYYGTAFVSGDIAIKGPIDEIKITAYVTTERDTEFFLPIDGATEVEKTNFVTFVNPYEQDTLTEKEELRLNPDKGVSIDFYLDINQNAEVGIIIDSEAGNQLHARGDGTIRFKMEPYDDIEMYGTYTAAEGYYILALPGIKRRFELLRGGSISWNGDPLDALINITARYTTKADPSALVGMQVGRTITTIDLYLSGELLEPDIKFDITAPRAGSLVQSILNNQLANRDKMYQQVFSILALNRFAPDQGLVLNGGATGWNVLAGQAAGYINQLTGDYEVSLEYQEALETDYTTTAFQDEVEVGVSKRFFDDRITVNGTVGVVVGEKQQDRSQVAGDFEIEYNISEDGRFRAKVFNRSIQHHYNLGQQYYQQGVGVFYRVDFTSWDQFFNEVFNIGKNKAVREEEEEPGFSTP